MAIPDAKFLGLRSKDFQECKLSDSVKITLNDTDRKRAKQIASYPWFAHKKQWQKEIKRLLDNGFKLEVEALISKDISYVTEQYTPAAAEGEGLAGLARPRGRRRPVGTAVALPTRFGETRAAVQLPSQRNYHPSGGGFQMDFWHRPAAADAAIFSGERNPSLQPSLPARFGGREFFHFHRPIPSCDIPQPHTLDFP